MIFTSTRARSSTVEYTVHVVQLYMYLGTAYALYKLLGIPRSSSTIQLYWYILVDLLPSKSYAILSLEISSPPKF